MDNGVDRGAGDAGGRAKDIRPQLGNVGVKGLRDGVGGLVGVACIGVGDGAVCPRLVTRKDVQLGFDHRCGDAALGHLRRLDKSHVGDRAGGPENTRGRRSRRAKETLRHQHSRT